MCDGDNVPKMNKKELLSRTKKLVLEYSPIICPFWDVKADIGDLGYPNPKALSIIRLDERNASVVMDYQVQEDELAHIVVHELYHVVLEPINQFCEILYKERTTESERNLMQRVYHLMMEETVEALTKGLMKSKGLHYGTDLNNASFYSK